MVLEEKLTEMESGAKKQEAEYFEALQKHSIGLKKMKTEVIFFTILNKDSVLFMTSHPS